MNGAILLWYSVHLSVLPLLLVGFIRTAKARLQNRRGPSILQPFWDTAKLLRKRETVSDTATWAFRWAPLVTLSTMISASFMLPWIGVESPISGDLFLLIYLLALGKFAAGLAALDTGSSFGAIGASREAAVSVQAEPALVIGLVALAAHAHSSSLSAMLTPTAGIVNNGSHLYLVVALVVVGLWISMTAELSRMPVDDPTTHLELTMIHEALILENSGRSLAFVEFAAALKMVLLFGLLAQIILLPFPKLPPIGAYAASMFLIICEGAVVALAESVLVKLRWRRIPNLLSYGVAAAVLACLVAAAGTN